MDHIHTTNGELHIEALSATLLASQYPTPFYCYSANAIRSQYQRFCAAFSDISSLTCYALKVNSNQAILTLLAKEGAGADVVSEGELRRALAAGISADKIVFSGVAKTSAEIAFALQANIRCFNIESLSELKEVSRVAAQLELTANISLRINPDVDAQTHAKISTGKSEDKFGIPYQHAIEIYQYAASLPGIAIVGIDMHIGSQIQQTAAFDSAIAKVVSLVDELTQSGITIHHIDVGGGLGVQYQNSDKDEETLLAEYAAIIHKYAKLIDCQFVFEPGRFITANAGVLITQVVYVKPVQNKSFVIVDAAMNDLIRPTLYDAWHNIAPVLAPDAQCTLQTVDIVGPVCESGDYLALDRQMPTVKANDLLAIYSAGAYGAVTANTYNSRRLIAEILVDNERSHVIRKSPSYQELINLDSVPDWLHSAENR